MVISWFERREELKYLDISHVTTQWWKENARGTPLSAFAEVQANGTLKLDCAPLRTQQISDVRDKTTKRFGLNGSAIALSRERAGSLEHPF